MYRFLAVLLILVITHQHGLTAQLNLKEASEKAMELARKDGTLQEWENLLTQFKNLEGENAKAFEWLIESKICSDKDYIKCIETCNKAYKIFEKHKNTIGLAMASKEISSKLTLNGHYSEALKYAKQCTTHCKDLYPELYVDCYSNISLIYMHNSDYEGNREMLRNIINYIQKNKLNSKLGKAYMNMGTSYHYQTTLDSALHYYEKAVLDFMTSDSELLAKVINNMGIISTTLGDYNKAQELFNQTVEIYKKLGLDNKISSIYNSIGNLYNKRNEQDSALVYYYKAQQIAVKNQDSVAQTRALVNIANAYYYKEDYSNALLFGEQALQWTFAIKDSIEITRSLNNNAYSLMKLGRFDEAKKNIDQSIEISKRIKDLELQHLALVALADYHLEQKDFEKALYAYVEATDIKSKYINEKRVAQYTEMQTKYKTAEKELLIKEKDLDIANERAKTLSLQFKIFTISIILLFVILLAGFLFLIQRNKNRHLLQQTLIEEQEKSIQAVIQAQEDERQRIAKELHDGIVQELTSIKIALGALRNQVHPENQEKVEKIVSQLDKSTRETREISHQMMPLALRELGLIPALEDVFERSFKPLSIEYEFEFVGMEVRLNEKQEISLFRIIQELINNCIKHSGANKVNINLQQTDKHILLIFEDNGKGFHESNANNGIGMQNLNSRVKIVNGFIRFESDVDKGLTVILKIPKL